MLMRTVAIETAHYNLLTAIVKCKIINNEQMNILDVVSLVQKLSSTEHAFICKVITILKVLLLTPPTNAVLERSFSKPKRLKIISIPKSMVKDGSTLHYYIFIVMLLMHLT